MLQTAMADAGRALRNAAVLRRAPPALEAAALQSSQEAEVLTSKAYQQGQSMLHPERVLDTLMDNHQLPRGRALMLWHWRHMHLHQMQLRLQQLLQCQ